MDTTDKQFKKMVDEQFCLSFELKTMSGIVNRGELERWVPGFCNPDTENEHLQRYRWVSQFTHGKKVADVACGTGKGSYLIATEGNAAHVNGYDIDGEVVRYASIRHAHENVSYDVKNAEQLHAEKQCNIVISFETIEHLDHPEQFLEQVKASLVEGGSLFVSTPLSQKNIDNAPHNKHHKTEWGFKPFQELVSQYFIIEATYVQLYEIKNKNILKRLVKKILHRKESVLLKDIALWNEQQFPSHLIGTKFKGYQILQCKK